MKKSVSSCIECLKLNYSTDVLYNLPRIYEAKDRLYYSLFLTMNQLDSSIISKLERSYDGK